MTQQDTNPNPHGATVDESDPSLAPADRSPSGRDLAAGLLADLGRIEAPEEGVRETDGHAAAAFAADAHKPPRARDVETQPVPVIVQLTPPLPAASSPPPSCGTTNPKWPPNGTLASAGVTAADFDDERTLEIPTVAHRLEDATDPTLDAPVSCPASPPRELAEAPRTSKERALRTPMGRTTMPDIRTRRRTRRAILVGFGVGAVLVAGVGVWRALSSHLLSWKAAATTTTSVSAAIASEVVASAPPPGPVAAPRPPASVVTVTAPPVHRAPLPASSQVAVPRGHSGSASSGGGSTLPQEVSGSKPPPPAITSKAPSPSTPIEEPDRTF